MKYDFETDKWGDDERVPYRLIRWWFLDSSYIFCRGDIHYNNRWQGIPLEHQIEYAWAYEQYEDSFFRPVERLMLEVVVLILYAGRSNEQTEYAHRNKIADILSKNDLQSLLSELPEQERIEFEEDLMTLKVIDTGIGQRE